MLCVLSVFNYLLSNSHSRDFNQEWFCPLLQQQDVGDCFLFLFSKVGRLLWMTRQNGGRRVRMRCAVRSCDMSSIANRHCRCRWFCRGLLRLPRNRYCTIYFTQVRTIASHSLLRTCTTATLSLSLSLLFECVRYCDKLRDACLHIPDVVTKSRG